MKIDVLDKGYIELVDTLGDDLTPVNAARVVPALFGSTINTTLLALNLV